MSAPTSELAIETHGLTKRFRSQVAVDGIDLAVPRGSVFGFLGAMVHFGRSRGGAYGVAIVRQYWQWALVIFVMGFLMPGVNNAAHAGGFLGGYLAALLLGYEGARPERGWHALAALGAAALTLAAFALALVTALG